MGVQHPVKMASGQTTKPLLFLLANMAQLAHASIATPPRC